MPLKVLVVPDKFKGTLSAPAAAAAIARGWQAQRSGDTLELLPMSDGGDGFGEVLAGLMGAKRQTLRTLDAAHRPHRAHWWWEPRSHTAIIESAGVIGLALLPRGKFHPFDLDTSGLGKVLDAATKRGAKRCLIGIGGSATNDGGFGFARALGWRFLDGKGREITRWTDLHRLVQLKRPARRRRIPKVIVAVDVQNPLLGPDGCSRVYGPQKGLRARDFVPAEKALGQLARVAAEQFGRDFAIVPGAGAAGGLGFGLMAFLKAQPQPGIDIFARHARLNQRIHASDVVITAEGAIDRQTVMGKGVGEIALRCASAKKPCIGLAGVVKHPRLARGRFAMVAGIVPALTDTQSAMSQPSDWLERLSAEAARLWTTRKSNGA